MEVVIQASYRGGECKFFFSGEGMYILTQEGMGV